MKEFKNDLEKFLNDYSEKLNLEYDNLKKLEFSEDFWEELKTHNSIIQIERYQGFIEMVKQDMKLYLCD